MSTQPTIIAEANTPTVVGSSVTLRNPTANARPANKKKKRSGNMAQGENTGRWTAEEHRLFLQGLEQHGKGWKKIASLIKSRTVVQIRTHAQKYFQKLAKARQNGEEGEVHMEGKVSSITSNNSVPIQKRRRQISGTKRKAIQSVVSSAIRQGKKLADAQVASGVPNPMAPLPAVSAALAYFVLPNAGLGGDNAPPTNQALEDSLFRFLTPCPPESETQVNDVARQAGANPITLPTDPTPTNHKGEASPTGVNELSIYPSWTDAKEAPSWYARGADVDALVDVGDTLDWLADSGDPNEAYTPPPPSQEVTLNDDDDDDNTDKVKASTSVSTMPRVDSNVDEMVPSLPSLFHTVSSSNAIDNIESTDDLLSAPSTGNLKPSTSGAMLDAHLQVFDSPMEEQSFVSTILETPETETTEALPPLAS